MPLAPTAPSLPGPSQCSYTKPERRAISPEGNRQARGRTKDRILRYELAYELTFSAAEAFALWHAITLANGQRRTSLRLPGPGGFLVRPVKFISAPTYELMPAIGQRVSFSVETL